MITTDTPEQDKTTNAATTNFPNTTIEPEKTLPDKRSEAKKAFDETRNRVVGHGTELAGKAKDSATMKADETVRSASRQVRNIEKAAQDAASTLREKQPKHVVEGVEYIAGRAANVAEYLETKDSKEIASDARQLVREHPGIVLGGLLAAGFCLGRFLKATTRDA